MGRPRSCDCGECPKCKNRIRQAAWYSRQSEEKRREIAAARDPVLVRESDRKRNKTAERRAHLTRNTRRWRKAHPERARAHNAVARALRSGKLVKEPCEVCGAVRVHAHHDDYSKPLEVRWLCPLHHAAVR